MVTMQRRMVQKSISRYCYEVFVDYADKHARVDRENDVKSLTVKYLFDIRGLQCLGLCASS